MFAQLAQKSHLAMWILWMSLMKRTWRSSSTCKQGWETRCSSGKSRFRKINFITCFLQANQFWFPPGAHQLKFANWSYKKFYPMSILFYCTKIDLQEIFGKRILVYDAWKRWSIKFATPTSNWNHGRIQVIQVGFFHVFFPPEILAPHVLFQADSYFWTVYPIVA